MYATRSFKLLFAALLAVCVLGCVCAGCQTSGSEARGVGLDITILDMIKLNLGVEEFKIKRPPESEDFEIRWSPVVHPKPEPDAPTGAVWHFDPMWWTDLS